MLAVQTVPGVTGVLYSCMTADVVLQAVSIKLPEMPTSIGDGRCFLRLGHGDLLP